MAVSVMVLGVSGTGKSASMRNCDPNKFALVNVAKKPLPFKGKFTDMFEGDNYQQVVNFIKNTKKKSIIIDDAQYLMGNEFMRRVTERGYDKFSEMAQNFWKLLNFINQDIPQDKIVYLLGHIEKDQDGHEKFKTMGKLIDQCINVEGTCTIVLKTHVADGQYSFLTQNSGNDTVKSPMGMFPSYAIDNDINYVDEKIRNYYEIGEFLSDKEMAEIDEEAKKVDVIKDDGKKKSRRKSKEESSDNVSEPADAAQPTSSDDEKPTRRSRRTTSEDVAERESEREAVQQRNAEKLANAGLEGDEEEGVPFDEVDVPELEKVPRKRKVRNEEPSEPETTAEESEATEEAAPARRRRRRAE